MKALTPAGILVSIFMALCGLFLLLCGGVMGFLGMWVDGSFDSVHLRVYGVSLFLLGALYVVPVMAFRRRSYVFAYLLSALCITALAMVAFFLEPSVAFSGWRGPVIYGGMLVFLHCDGRNQLAAQRR